MTLYIRHETQDFGWYTISGYTISVTHLVKDTLRRHVFSSSTESKCFATKINMLGKTKVNLRERTRNRSADAGMHDLLLKATYNILEKENLLITLHNVHSGTSKCDTFGINEEKCPD